MKKATVAILRCETYDPNQVTNALRRGFDLLGGLKRFVNKGEQILLKPNILAGVEPDRAVTTHPSVLEATIKVLLEVGADVSYGDSPGIFNPWQAVKESGFQAVALKYAIKHGNFESSSTVQFPKGRIHKHFPIAKAVQKSDGIFSLPKMKTHRFSRITGAVKNQFGCIPGLNKPALHLRFRDIMDFSRMLADLNLLLRPRIYIMDGIIAMEGNGPRNGDPIPMNVLIMSQDPVAVDATFCRLIDLNPEFVPTNLAGMEAGLGTYLEDEIEYRGDALTDLMRPAFRVVRKEVSADALIKHFKLIKNLLVPRPVIDRSLCVGCGICVKACPVPEKAVRFSSTDHKLPPVFDYNLCIRCYCCEEMCPHRTITIKTPFLGKLLTFLLQCSLKRE